MADETCRAFDADDVAPALDKNKLNRFVVGADATPRAMSAAEVKALGDAVSTLLFAKGKFPRTAEQTVDMIKAGAPANSALKKQRSFVLAEGHEGPNTLPKTQAAVVAGNLRFVVTLGQTPEGPDVLVSASHPKQPGGIEVMAWDRTVGGFNWYRSTGSQAMWMFAGNSRDALRDTSRGKGPFESHPSGSLLMKELRTPWVHWHSAAAPMRDDILPANDVRRTHPWFTKKEPAGAIPFEFEAARPSMERWAKARFAELRGTGGTVARPKQIVEHIVSTPTVNLHSTHVTNAGLSPSDQLDLPTGFFVDVDGFAGELGFDAPPQFQVSGKIYANCLTKFDVQLQGAGFKRKGDTHFCFVIPERAFEDQVALREAMSIGLVSKRLAACLLTVDPWNPVFSARRRSLLKHCPPTATISNGSSSFSQDMANRILDAAKTGPAGTPEAEFAKRWNVGAGFATEFNKILNAYYAKVQERLKTQSGFDAYFRLAETRRAAFKQMPIAEFPLLLPTTNVPIAPRRMLRDGTVEG